MAQLRLKLFGAPRLERDGQPIKLETWKAAALLAYLALNQQTHQRGALATLFWPDQGETQARSSLRRTLWTVRQALNEDGIYGDKQTVGLQMVGDWVVDVLHFQRIVATGNRPANLVAKEQIEHLRAAVALYQADFLAGFTLPDCPAFDEWQFFTATRLRETLATILQRLIEWDTAQQNYPAAIEAARRWVMLDNLHEPAQQCLMQLYALAGQPAAALRQYEECKRLLNEELGVPPADATTQLATTIRTNRPAVSTAAPLPTLPSSQSVVTKVPDPHNLPAQATPLLGRTLELAELDLLMFDRNARLITITGPGGMGKTRLALAVAERHLAANRLRDGAWLVELAAVEEAQAIVPALAKTLGLAVEHSKDSNEELQQQVVDFLRAKQLLLVFDNFEQVLEGRTLLAEILTVAPQVYIVVTSRERLHLRNEQIYPIGGLEYPATITDVDAPALLFFLEMVRHSLPTFQPTPQELHELVLICQLTGGMPLALELAAGWVQLLPFSAIREAIQTNLDLLERTEHDTSLRHRSMRATFDTTWTLLTAEERAGLVQLSVFRGGFTRASAQQVAAVTVKQLAVFVNKSLVDYHRATDRYRFHELLRQYIIEKLAEVGARDEAQWRHLRYFVTLAETLTSQSRSAEKEAALALFDHENDNFRTALAWGLSSPIATQPIVTAAWLMIHLERLWDLRKQWQEGRDWLAKALTMLENPAINLPHDLLTGEKRITELKAALLLHAGRFANDFSVAQTFLEESLALYRRLENPHLLAESLYALGETIVNRGDYARADTLYTEGLAYARQVGEPELIANGLVRLGNLLLEENKAEQATLLFEESLELFLRQQDSAGVRSVQISLAQCHLARGGFAQTSAILEEMLALDRIVNPQSKGGPWTYRVLGLAEQMQGNYAQAATYYQRSLLLRQEQQEAGGMAWALEGLVEVAAALQQSVRAARLAGAAASLRQQVSSTIAIDDQARYEQALHTICAVIGEARFQAAWASGASLSTEQIVAYALDTAV